MTDPSAAGELVVLERLTKEARQLAYDFLSPGAKASGEFFGDWIRSRHTHWEVEKAIEVLQRAVTKLAEVGLTPQAVSKRILLPSLENAALLEDNEHNLFEQWAGLLASASADGDSVHPSFPEILRQLTSEEARTLEVLRGFSGWTSAPVEDVQRAAALTPEQFTIVKDRLVQLGLIQHGVTGNEVQPGEAFFSDSTAERPIFEAPAWSIHRATHLRLTAIGFKFVDACRGPRKKESDNV